jgi:hypothetical protein
MADRSERKTRPCRCCKGAPCEGGDADLHEEVGGRTLAEGLAWQDTPGNQWMSPPSTRARIAELRYGKK